MPVRSSTTPASLRFIWRNARPQNQCSRFPKYQHRLGLNSYTQWFCLAPMPSTTKPSMKAKLTPNSTNISKNISDINQSTPIFLSWGWNSRRYWDWAYSLVILPT